MTQCEQILRHMEQNGSISSLEAMQEYGIMRLASRITDLKKAGIPTPFAGRWLVKKTATAKQSLLPGIQLLGGDCHG